MSSAGHRTSVAPQAFYYLGPFGVLAEDTVTEEGFQKGWLVSTEGCLPSALGVRVRAEGNDFLVKDGPFTESKEVVGGFAIIKAASKAEAVELTKKFMSVAGHGGECELRQLYEAHDAPCATVTAAKA